MQTSRKAFNNNKKLIQDTIKNLKPNQYLRLRRMTPAEYLRLMGLSEKYIKRMVEDSGNSDKELYKQGGNSIVVDVLYHIFYKMFIDRGPNPGEPEPLDKNLDDE